MKKPRKVNPPLHGAAEVQALIRLLAPYLLDEELARVLSRKTGWPVDRVFTSTLRRAAGVRKIRGRGVCLLDTRPSLTPHDYCI